MKALVKTKHGEGNVELLDLPEPQVTTPNGVKVEIKFGGICGTDIHVYHDTFPNYPPVILGHELSGVIVEVGPEVKKVKPGDPVTILGSTMVKCGTCEYCTRGYYMFCSIRRGMGHGVSGGFTKYVVVREDMVYKVPAGVSLEEAALSEAFATAVQSIEEITPFCVGDTVLLSGPGPIGLLCLTLLLAHGCKVIVAGTKADSERLKLAKKIGADLTVDVTSQDLQEIVKRETNGLGVDISMDCAGAGASISSCLKALKSMGRHIQVGIVGKDVAIDIDSIIFKRLQILGSVGHSLQTWDRLMKIMAQHKVDLTLLISHKMPLSKWREAFDLCENKQGMKVLLYYDEP